MIRNISLKKKAKKEKRNPSVASLSFQILKYDTIPQAGDLLHLCHFSILTAVGHIGRKKTSLCDFAVEFHRVDVMWGWILWSLMFVIEWYSSEEFDVWPLNMATSYLESTFLFSAQSHGSGKAFIQKGEPSGFSYQPATEFPRISMCPSGTCNLKSKVPFFLASIFYIAVNYLKFSPKFDILRTMFLLCKLVSLNYIVAWKCC